MPFPAKTSAEAILAAALDLLEGGGAEALTMRALAQRLKLAPNAIYRYYASREALIGAIAASAGATLNADLEAAAQGRAGRKAVRAAAGAYLAFARSRPAMFAALTACGPPPDGCPDPRAATRAAFARLLGAVVDDEAPRAALTLVAYLDGMAALERAGQAGDGLPDWGLRALLKGLRRMT